MYGVIEIQTNNNVMVIGQPVTKETRDEAEQAFHQVCAYAAVSAVQIHTVLIVNAEGALIKKESYKHSASN